MKKGKNFFYRIEPMAVLSEMILIPELERGEWATQFFVDLKNGDLENTSSSLAVEIIKEALEYRDRRANAGKQGGEAKSSNAKAKASNATNSCSKELAISSSSSSSSNSNIKSKVKSFVTPSIEEVTAYCQERGNRVDPQRWMNHYVSNGWMVGKNKMKNWQAAVRTWEGNGKENPSQRLQPKTFEQIKMERTKQAMMDFVGEEHDRPGQEAICFDDGNDGGRFPG